jgi:hypothetical protein
LASPAPNLTPIPAMPVVLASMSGCHLVIPIMYLPFLFKFYIVMFGPRRL